MVKLISMRGDGARVAYPLFQMGDGGSLPTSPLQMTVYNTTFKKFEELNRTWHSRLPNVGGFYVDGLFFSAVFNGVYFAVSGWSAPIARMLNDRRMYELRRLAIAPDAPKNTASWMIAIMTKLIRKEKQYIKTLISYQDVDVHTGTIYKASGWKNTHISERGDRNWVVTHKRASTSIQTDSPKIRWEKDIR